MKSIHDPGLRLFKDYPVGKVSQGVYVDDIYTDFSVGSLRQTSGSLDVALNGQGFFIVAVNGEELLTRDGTFVLYPDGTLATKDGGHVQGANGDIRLPNGIINIDESGRIFVDGEFIDTIRTTDITDKHTLRAFKDNYYRTTAESEMSAYGGSVVQGFLENSNVSSVKEMVEMITLSRIYEANSRMIMSHDTTLGRAVNDIARR
jgi:flagellar basal-body rod protein FlgG